MTPSDFDRDQELVVDGPTTFPVDRRDFVKLTATGLLVLLAVDPASAGQETARLPGIRPTSMPTCILAPTAG
jgi:hypothetical protein